ncbi:MAG TPA: hypothetical protein PKV05_08370 [Bacillota bacterium]|nr:hypothetical protein [Bacillota bacterium]
MQDTNNKAVASLVLGILSVCFIFVGQLSLIGLILGIIGLILGINAKKESPANNGAATAGIIMSAISVGICGLFLLSCVACFGCGLLGFMAY